MSQKLRTLEQSVEELARKVGELEDAFEQETDELYQRLSAMSYVEVGITSDGVIKGTLEWVGFDAIGLKTTGEQPEEVIIFKNSITYIRSFDGRAKDHTGMYV